MIKIHQIYYKEDHINFLEKNFIPYNNIQSPAPKECEYNIFLNEYLNNKIQDNDLVGYVSWKFKNKSGISGDYFKSFIENNPGYDLYFVNPYEFFTYIYYNTWYQGVTYHPNIIDLSKYVFENIGYDKDWIINQRHHIENSMFCNYWVGNKKFWDRYIGFTQPIYNYIKNNKDPNFQHIMFNANLWGTLSYFPYIMERSINTLINLNENKDLKIIRCPNNLYVNSWPEAQKYIHTFKNIIDSIDKRAEYKIDDLTFLKNMNRFVSIISKIN